MPSIRRTLSSAIHSRPNRKSRSKWHPFLHRCFLFFFLGFLLALSPFNSTPNLIIHNDPLLISTHTPPLIHSHTLKLDIDDDDLVVVVVRKQLIIVTPTYNRVMQAFYLNRLAQVIALVEKPVLWIVVEMNGLTDETASVLRRSGVMYRHLVCDMNMSDVKDRGVYQRNVALEHIERHKLDGIVYFADDDNVYSLQLFQRLREIRRFGTWPVAMLAPSKNKAILEGAICNSSQVIGWHTNEKSKKLRRFHVDMSGFAFNSTILWDPKRWNRRTTSPIRQLDSVKEGFQETTFIEQVVEDESQMEGITPGCDTVMNWHLHLESTKNGYPKGWLLQNDLSAVLALN